ncbi:MAG TPA: trypsin-like peptidase domain-containing protein [Allosphingosinicella sp.]|nr:trypsin-like peptidase domain-containing protein [Allosphingosinicella sp.]
MVDSDSNDERISLASARAAVGEPPLSASGHSGRPPPPAAARRRSMKAGRFGANAGLASIIGDDDRTILFETRNRPERMICALRIRAAGRLFHGSGWLAGPRLVMTCGHCVFHPAMNGWAEAIEIDPGLSEDLAPFGTVSSTRFSAARQWTRDGDKAFDVGAIHLAEPLGDQLGWFAVEAASDPRALVGRRATISGYPLFDGVYSRQMRHDDTIAGVADGRLFYPIDTDEGQSGSPIWLGDGDVAEPVVIGIHAYEKQQTPPRLGVEANSGTPITLGVLQLIETWKQATA